jgi:hypothetical protein
MAPASSIRSTAGAFSGTGASGLVFEPRRIGCPAQYRLSLTVNGSPSAIPFGSALDQRASESAAAFRAASASMMQNALIAGLCRSMAASAASTTSLGERVRLR